jgi:hypothetical protein
MSARTLTLNSSADELVKATGAGWPRARLAHPAQLRALPLPWINGTKPAFEPQGWKMLDAGRRRDCEELRLCFCCGERLDGLSVMGRHRASFRRGDRWVWLTDGPAGHPRCMALAAVHCPHLRDQHRGRERFIIAFTWRGLELGYVETPEEIVAKGEPRFIVRPGAKAITLGTLRKLAKADPLGER